MRRCDNGIPAFPKGGKKAAEPAGLRVPHRTGPLPHPPRSGVHGSVREEYAAYLRQLDERKIRYRIVEEAAQADGSILLKIKRQNNQCDVGAYLDD